MTKTTADRLATLNRAVWNGASNPPLIKRANRIADDLQAEHPELAARLRVALTRRGESLEDRYERIAAIARDLA